MNITGNKKDTVYKLMGSIKVPDEFAKGPGMAAGIRKVDNKDVQGFLKGLGDRVGITFQRDNRGLSGEEIDVNPYLKSNSIGKGAEARVSHLDFFSNTPAAKRDDNGKVMKDGDGNILREDKVPQTKQIFDKLDTVEIAKTKNGTFMHFSVECPVKVVKSGGLIPDFENMRGLPAEKGMGDAQFNTTLAEKRARKAAASAEQAAAPAAEEAAANAEAVAEGVDLGPEA